MAGAASEALIVLQHVRLLALVHDAMTRHSLILPLILALTLLRRTGGETGPGDPQVGENRQARAEEVGLLNRDTLALLAQELYPAEMLSAGLRGAVQVGVLVGTDGELIRAVILRSSGQSAFDVAALVVAHHARFSPARSVSGEPVPSWVALPVRFYHD